jgi:phage tail-like protein
MMTHHVNDPCTNINFRAEFDGLAVEGFCYISGLESLVEIVEDTAANTRKPGDQSCENIILRRAIDERRDLWDWYRSTLSGEKAPRDGSIVILNAARDEFLRIHVRQAWPCRWKLTALDALHPEVLMEEIELVVESLHVH